MDEVIIINEKGCKRCRISNKINEEGGIWNRIISEKDKICALRAEKYEKTIIETLVYYRDEST